MQLVISLETLCAFFGGFSLCCILGVVIALLYCFMECTILSKKITICSISLIICSAGLSGYFYSQGYKAMKESLPKELVELSHNISKITDEKEKIECFNFWKTLYPDFVLNEDLLNKIRYYSYFPENITNLLKRPKFVYEKLP